MGQGYTYMPFNFDPALSKLLLSKGTFKDTKSTFDIMP